MNRVTGNALKVVVLSAASFALTGCFNNISGVDGVATRSSQSNGTTLNDGGFSNETGPIDTAAVLVGTYNDPNGSGYGLMIDLQKSLLATLGATSLQSILDTIDTNSAMQARSVIVHIPSFAIKATTTLGKIAAGNNKKLRNIMNIRPRLSRIDLTTSALEVPASPSVYQMNNANKTVITYGGKIEGDYVRRMTVLIPFAGVNANFLPSISVPTYGDGYPSASPQEYPSSVKLVKVTADIAALFGKMMTNVPYGTSILNSVQSDAIKTINQTKDSLVLAVHYKIDPVTGLILTDTQTNLHAQGFVLTAGSTGIVTTGVPLIDAAYFININPANNSGPETFAFCHSGFDSQEQTSTYGTNADEADFAHPLACNCTAAKVYAGSTNPVSVPLTNQFTDPCPNIGVAATTVPLGIPTMTFKQKKDLIADAVAAMPAAPTGPIVISSPMTLNDFVISAE